MDIQHFRSVKTSHLYHTHLKKCGYNLRRLQNHILYIILMFFIMIYDLYMSVQFITDFISYIYDILYESSLVKPNNIKFDYTFITVIYK